MNIEIKSLAQWKRWLAEPGSAVELTQHDWYPQGKLIGKVRKVAKVQTNGVAFLNPDDNKTSWLYFDRGAADFRFDKDVVIVALDSERTGFDRVMKFKLHKVSA